MLPINDLSNTEILRIRTACAYLFSPELAKNDQYLKDLNLFSVKSAYKEKSKKYHPDIKRDEPEEITERRKERFIKIQESYKILKGYIIEEDKSAIDRGVRQSKIIAVGGAKGGIGKSIFATNLGVFLSSKGMQTVLIDLDLGSANLHLYLGKTSLECNINDFLTRRIPTINEIMVPTNYGPSLIGGDSSELGATNINYSKKLKLLRAIKEIDSDYIILDLGGDTSYNIIDFFLLADHKFVVTTCDPASFLDAYNFIKVALYRKLTRLFAPESEFKARKDKDLELLIQDATISTNGNKVKNINQLINMVKEKQPWNLSLISGVIKAFNPKLIVNMVAEDSNAMQVVNRIQEVSRKMLSIQVGYLGSIPFKPEIQRSARDLVPVVLRYPEGVLSRTIEHVLYEIGYQ